MPNQEIVNYITQTKEKGYTGEQITQALKEVGWQEKDIEEGFKYYLERVAGVGPASFPWQGNIIAAIRYPRG